MKSIQPTLKGCVCAALAGVVLASCAAPAAPSAAPTDAPAQSSATTAPSSEATSQPEATSAATPATAGRTTYPLTVEIAGGAVTLDRAPQRVVVLEWSYVEAVLALGVQPIAVADIKGYNSWVRIPVALDVNVADVGQRNAPNLEAITQLKPDLIIMPSFRAADSQDKLKAIAPTLLFNPYPTDESVSQYDEMIQTFTTIGRVLDRQAEAAAVLDGMAAKFAEAQATLDAAGKRGETFVLAQAWSQDNAAAIRLFTRNGMATHIVEQIGLVPAWLDGFQPYGYTDASIETLPQLGDAHFFYVVQADDDPFQLSAIKPLWDNLAFVKAGKAYSLGGDTWLFGGPLSAQALVDLVVSKLVPAAVPTGASTSPTTVTYPLVITDAVGQVFTFTQAPKIGCWWAGCTEIMADLGVPAHAGNYADNQTGSAFFYPNGLPEQRIQDSSNPEQWANAGVDVILMRVPPTPDQEAVKAAAPIFYLHHPSYGESAQKGYQAFVENLHLVSQLIGNPAAADQAIAQFEAALANLKKIATADTARLKVAVLFNGEGYAAIGPGSPFCVALAEVGLGQCVGEGAESLDINAEAFLTMNPDWVVYQIGDQSFKDRTDPVWSQLSAVKAGQVYDAKGHRYYCCSTRGLIHALQEYTHYVVPTANIPEPGLWLDFDPNKSPLIKR